MPNMKRRPSFCFIRSCRLRTIGMGRTNRITSDAMLQTAVAIYNAAELIQVPVVMVTSKLFWTGVHANIRLKNMPIATRHVD